MSREMKLGETLTHLDEAGRAQMVDVGAKVPSRRLAVARGEVHMSADTLAAILGAGLPKGDVLAVARIAGITAAKRTSELIPLCHSLPLDAVQVRFRAMGGDRLEIEAEAAVTGRTGVEMEAMVAVAVAGLTVYDMCKAIDRGMTIGRVRLVSKSGGRSGEFQRDAEEVWEQWM